MDDWEVAEASKVGGDGKVPVTDQKDNVDRSFHFIRHLYDDEVGAPAQDDDDYFLVKKDVPVDKLTAVASIKQLLVHVGRQTTSKINDSVLLEIMDAIAAQADFPFVAWIPKLATCLVTVLTLPRDEAIELLWSTFGDVSVATVAIVIYFLVTTGGVSLTAALILVINEGLLKSAFAGRLKSKAKGAKVNSKSQIADAVKTGEDLVKKLKDEQITDEKLVASFDRAATAVARGEAADEISDDIPSIPRLRGSLVSNNCIYLNVGSNGEPYIRVQIKDGKTEDFPAKTVKAYVEVAVASVIVHEEETEDAAVIAEFDEKNILILDLTERTFDVSLLTIGYGVFEVARNGRISLENDFHLAEPIYRTIMECLITFVMDISSDKRALETEAKKALFDDIETLFDSPDPVEFDLFRKTMGPVEQVMDDAGIGKYQIQEVVVVGGSTRIQKLEQLLHDYLNNKEPKEGGNPDGAVASGAAVKGSLSSGKVGHDNKARLALGIETYNGIMNKLILRNTVFPTTKSRLFTTLEDKQTTVRIQIYEGERKLTMDCLHLGTFVLRGIPPADRGTPRIRVTFDVDANGVLNVKAADEDTGKSKRITITNMSRLNQEEIAGMLKEAEDKSELDCMV